MKKFEELDKRSVHEVETDILNNWKKNNILEKTIKNREGKEDYVYSMMDQQLLMVCQVYIICLQNF